MKPCTVLIGLITAIGLHFTPTSAIAQNLPDAAAVSRYADRLLNQQGLDAKSPGVAILVARGDELLLHTARGLANVELGVPLQPEHRLRISSLAKQITAAMLLKLVEGGKARLEDPLAAYLPDYPNASAITLAMLLNHTSGIKNYVAIDGFWDRPMPRTVSTADLISVFKGQPADFAPGTRYAYSNSGYVLVGAVIEAITGKPWWDGLSALKAPLFYPHAGQLIPGQVSGYMLNAEGKVIPAQVVNLEQSHAAGSLVGDLKAVWRWNQQLHEGDFLKPASLQRMTTPEGAAAKEGYGFGVYASTLRGQRLITHGAGHHGAAAWLHYMPAQRITVVLMRNAEGAGALDTLGRQLAAFAAGTAFPDIKPIALTTDELKRFEGVYRLGDTTRVLRVVGDALVSKRDEQRTFTLIPIGPARFAFTGGLGELALEQDASGKVNALRMFPNGEGPGEVMPRVADLQRP